jgi:hypothetical protein
VSLTVDTVRACSLPLLFLFLLGFHSEARPLASCSSDRSCFRAQLARAKPAAASSPSSGGGGLKEFKSERDGKASDAKLPASAVSVPGLGLTAGSQVAAFSRATSALRVMLIAMHAGMAAGSQDKDAPAPTPRTAAAVAASLGPNSAACAQSWLELSCVPFSPELFRQCVRLLLVLCHLGCLIGRACRCLAFGSQAGVFVCIVFVYKPEMTVAQCREVRADLRRFLVRDLAQAVWEG